MLILTSNPQKQMRLSEEFLAPYYYASDPFKSLLARSTYLTKYSRNSEVWTDTIRRVVEGNTSLASNVHLDEMEKLFHYFWTGQALPPGRGLWTGGVEGIPSDARYNCFRGTTRFFADGKLATLQDLAGQTVKVRCVDGDWRSAEVRCFGKQKLFKYVLRAPGRSKFELIYEATENHRWLTDNRGMIEDLRVGDIIRVTPDTFDDQAKGLVEYKNGFAHGLVFGDGSSDGDGFYRLRLCGSKSAYLDSLKESPYFRTASYPPNYNGEPSIRLHSQRVLKAVPEEGLSFVYQAGFLAGWLASDGSLRASGRGGNRLSSINHDALNWVTERAPFLGYCVSGDTLDSSTETNYGVRNGQVRVLTLTSESVIYTVRQKVDEGLEEEVYCVTEPETHTFTIEGGVRTGQCWYTTLYGVDDWCWTANQLMLGGGVGVGLAEIGNLPVVSQNPARLAVWCVDGHVNLGEVNPDAKSYLNGQTPVLRVPDSREGWVEALRQVLTSAFEGRDLIVDVSDIRARGLPIRTFGGIACGPGPLVSLLRNSWDIIRNAVGRRLSSVEALDITNYVGLCIKAGNVRRSALIVLGDAQDQAFRDAKKDFDKVRSHRHTSNNSIVFRSWEQIAKFDWENLVEDNLEFGEPGLLNLPLVWASDPGAKGVNPCGEQALHDREACNLAEVFPAQFESHTNPTEVLRLVTRYCLRQRLTPLTDAKSQEVGNRNMRVGVGLGGLCDFDWTRNSLRHFYGTCRDEANRYASELGVAAPITVTTVKPSGTISLLNGSSPGIHAPYAAHYIRRTRIAKNDPLAAAMIEAKVPHEEDVYDKTGHTWVFSFPTKAAHTKFTVQTETIRDQFERQKAVQEAWADNAVSATLSFEESEKHELAACLKEYVPFLKSTSVLNKVHGYVQPPYEVISEEQYGLMYSHINHSHPLVRGGEMEVEECAGGVCPIR